MTFHKTDSRGAVSLLGAIGLGAGLMFVLDPRQGKRRRAMARDKLVRAIHELRDLLDVAGRDLAHRAQGLAAETRARLRHEDVPDEVLEARVRAALGRCVSHPHAIEVSASRGVVTLKGPILADEVDDLFDHIGRVRGVIDVKNRLEAHESGEGIPSLQGGRRRRGPRIDVMQENWAPATRLIVGVGGILLNIVGMRRRGVSGALLGTIGGGILLRAALNRPTKRIVGVGVGRRAVDLHKTITVHAPIDEVWRLWSNIEQFPRFLDHVRSVRRTGDRISHWVVDGPMGTEVRWDAEITYSEPDREIAWKTVPGSTVEHAGVVKFEEVDGATRLDIRLSYNPPAGMIGHAVASLFRRDPKHELDDDMLRLKSLLEDGKARAHGHQVTREEILTAARSAPPVDTTPPR